MNIVSLLDVAPFSGKRVKPFSGNKKYLSTGGLVNGELNLEDVAFDSKPSRADIVVSEGDILFARMKDTNKVLMVDSKLDGIIVSTGFSVHRPIDNTHPQYLAIFFKSKEFIRQKNKYCSGAIQSAITNAGIKKIKITLPTYDDQIRIATLLSRVETLIATRKNNLQQLDDFLKSTFLDMFGPGSEDYESWPLVEIKELAEKKKGSMRTGPFGSNLKHDEFTESGDVAVLGIDNAVNNKFSWGLKRYISYEKYEQLKQYTVYPGDVIVTIMGTIGRSAVIPDDIPLSINTKHLAAITLDKNKANPEFVSYSIHSSPYVIAQFKSRTRGAIMSGLNLGIIKETKIKNPPIELQNKFGNIIQSVEYIKSLYDENLDVLENLYGALSQKAFKGELDLSRVPLPEEAMPNMIERTLTDSIDVTDQIKINEYSMSGPQARKALLRNLFDTWLAEQQDQPLSLEAFWQHACFQTGDRMDENSPPLGVEDYDQLKGWLFELVRDGKLEQAFVTNAGSPPDGQIELKAKG